jgi:hypothetical protein
MSIKKSGLDKLHKNLDKAKKTPRRLLHLDPLDIECCFEKDATSGSLHMTLSTVGGEFEQGGKNVGNIRGCIGGGLEINIDGYSYYLGVMPLWNAVSAAHERWKKDQKQE